VNARADAVAAQLKRSKLRFVLSQIGDKTHHAVEVVEHHRKMIHERQEHLFYQFIMLAAAVTIGVILQSIGSIGSISFVYPYLDMPLRLDNVVAFWPLFAYGISLFILSWMIGEEKVYSSHLDGKLWRYGMATGNLAAIWEELGYRMSFVGVAMIMIVIVNWILGTAFGVVLVVAAIVIAFGLIVSDNAPSSLAVVPLIVGGGGGFALATTDPLYWFYESIMIPLINFCSLGSFDSILVNPEVHDPLFLMGAVLANAWFRDGHQYQGPTGLLNAWIYGFVAIYATMTYGLLTAIVIHALWNSMVSTLRYLKRKVS
jgi:hypothetical protein